jgi:hypothetical protein
MAKAIRQLTSKLVEVINCPEARQNKEGIMKRVQGNNLFTIESISRNKPALRPEIADKVNALLEDLKDGESAWFDDTPSKDTEG